MILLFQYLSREAFRFPIILFAALLASVGQIFLKIAAVTSQESLVSLLFNIHVLTGSVLYILAVILYLIALKSASLSIAYPLISVSYVLIIIFSSIFLDEPITLYKLIGVGFIITGAIFLMISR